MKRVLHIAVYRRLLAAFGLNELAWSVGTLALAVLVYRHTGSALGATGFFLCSQFLPALLTPLLVSRMEQRPPRRALPVLYAIEAALFGVLAALTSRFSLAAVLVVVFLDGAVAVVARSLVRACIVATVRPLDLLPEANAVVSLVFSASYMAGPAIGGVVVAAGGTVDALLINCGLFAAIALVLVTATGIRRPAEELEPGKRRLRGALSYVRNDPALRTMLSLRTAQMIVFTISIPVEVVLASHTLGAGAGGYGALMSGWGAGAVLGSAAFVRWRRRPAGILVALSGLAMAVGFGIMAAAPTIVVAVIGAVFGGLGNGAGMVAGTNQIQEYTPERWTAVVTGLNESIFQVGPGLGILIGGGLTTLAGPRIALSVGAAAGLLWTVAAWVQLRPGVLPAPPPLSAAQTAEPDGAEGPLVPVALESRETLA
ncbi:MAG: MFS transporter [Actinomycetota bacterium]|nr:MFS transporter [Actinomycetota bacterium]